MLPRGSNGGRLQHGGRRHALFFLVLASALILAAAPGAGEVAAGCALVAAPTPTQAAPPYPVGQWTPAGASAAAASSCGAWIARYDGEHPATDDDFARALVASPDGERVYVTGSVFAHPHGDHAMTVAYDAETGAQLWATPDHAGSTDTWAIGLSPDGSTIFVAGSIYWIGSGSPTDFTTMAYDAATGASRWTARYQSPDSDVARALAVSPDGTKLHVTGASYRVEAGALTGSDYVTVTYDVTTGDQLWVARYDGSGNGYDRPAAIATDLVGGRVYVTGASDGDSTGRDAATVAYDAATGELLWLARYDGSGGGYDSAAAIAVGLGGERVYVAGGSGGDYVTVSYDAATGVARWIASYEGPGSASALAVAPDGAWVYVTGANGQGNVRWRDYATVAYDAASGAESWDARYDGPSGRIDSPTAIAVRGDGMSVLVTGQSDGGATGFDYATVAYDAASGAELGVGRYNGPANLHDAATAMGIGPDGTVFVTGSSTAINGGAKQYDYIGLATERDWATLSYSPGSFASRPAHAET